MIVKIEVSVMNDDEIYFDMDENMGSYYDFNLLDLLEDNEYNNSNAQASEKEKLIVKLG
jgi:hypothetical protein